MPLLNNTSFTISLYNFTYMKRFSTIIPLKYQHTLVLCRVHLKSVLAFIVDKILNISPTFEECVHLQFR